MKKSVYSLVLGDEVVREIDKKAYKLGTSRSNLINQILAENIGYLTDERRMGEVFQHAKVLLEDLPGLQVSPKSDTVMVIRSALNYKYNPSMRYAVTLKAGDSGVAGELRTSLRSQNRELLFHLRRFFTLWSKIEEAYGKQPRFEIDSGRFVRFFTIPDRLEDDRPRQAQMIVNYVAAMNDAFGGYFENTGDMTAAVKAIERVYLEYLKNQKDPF